VQQASTPTVPLDGFTVSATTGDRTVVATRSVDGTTAFWLTRDGIAWQRTMLQGEAEAAEVRDLAVGPHGFIAVGDGDGGAAAWISQNGESWERVEAPAFAGGRGWHVATTAVALVMFGDSGAPDHAGRAWRSTDGRSWQLSTDASSLEVADGVRSVISGAERETAFVVPGWRGDGRRQGPAEVWQTSDGDAWTRVSTLGAEVIDDIVAATSGPVGWVALGSRSAGGVDERLAWTSVDGIDWQAAPSGPHHVTTIVADPAGFIVVGGRDTVGGCTDRLSDYDGETWTSTDGRAWHHVPFDPQFARATIQALYVRDRTLFGIGTAFLPYDGDFRETAAVWEAQLPDERSLPGPEPSPIPAPTTEPGCGG
jgi:hypothetical protein